MCGLKHLCLVLLRPPYWSHPAWVCGLKLFAVHRTPQRIGHTLRGCVDWNIINSVYQSLGDGHTLRGCVDWNFFWWSRIKEWTSHTLRGCVDWNTRIDAFWAFLWVTPCVGVWIETAFIILARAWAIVTPCVGVWIETYELRNALDYGTSHPAWVCGLKQLKKKIPVVMFVTPCVGVWIETMLFLCVWFLVLCHTLRGCVDWN